MEWHKKRTTKINIKEVYMDKEDIKDTAIYLTKFLVAVILIASILTFIDCLIH